MIGKTCSIFTYIYPQKCRLGDFFPKKNRAICPCLKEENLCLQETRNPTDSARNSPIELCLCQLCFDISHRVLYIWLQLERCQGLSCSSRLYILGRFLSSRWSRGDNQTCWTCDCVIRIVHSFHHDRTSLYQIDSFQDA